MRRRAISTPSAAERRIHAPERAAIALTALLGGLWLSRTAIRAVSDPDAWLHLRIGTFLNDGGSFASGSDPWSSNAVRSYVPTQWLGERLGADVFARFGLPGVAYLRTLCVILTFLALLWTCRQVADTLPAALTATLGLLTTAASMAERPQAAAVVILTVVTGIWWRSTRTGRVPWELIPLTWLMACLHGLWIVAVAFGFLFVVVMMLDRVHPRRTILLMGSVPALSVLAAAMTPLGPRLLLTPFQVGSAVSQFVQEWQPPTTHNPVWLFTVAYAAVALGVSLRRPGPIPWSRLLLLGAGLVAASWNHRLTVVGTLLLAPLAAEALQSLRARRPSSINRSEAAAWGGYAGVALVAALIAAPSVAAVPSGVPTGLRTTLAQLPEHTVVYADHGLTGWIEWVAPQVDVVIDLRSEIHSPALISRFIRTNQAKPSWDTFLSDTATDVLLLPEDSPLADALDRDETWIVAGSDNGYRLFRQP